MLERRGLRDRLIGLVEQILGPSAKTPFPVDQQLSEIGMSSLKMVNLMLDVESEFQIAIPQTEITPENFHSLASIEVLITKILTSAGAN